MQVDWGALGTEAFVVEIVEGAAQAMVEDGASANCEGVVLEYAEACSVEGINL